jgi:hypothetical protein
MRGFHVDFCAVQKQTGFNAADYESIAKLLLEKSRKLLDQKDAEFRSLCVIDVLGERYWINI